MSFFSGLSAERYDRSYSNKELIKRILNYLLLNKKQITLIVFSLIIIAISNAASPYLVSRGIETIKKFHFGWEILLLPILVLFNGILGWFVIWYQKRLSTRAIAGLIKKISVDAYEATIFHDMVFFDQYAIGKIASRISTDTEDFSQMLVLTTDLFAQIIEIFLLSILLITINFRLYLYLIFVIPVIFLVATSFRTIARKTTQQGMRAISLVNSSIKESFSGILIAKNFNREDLILKEFLKANLDSYKVNLKRGMILASIFPSLNALSGVVVAYLIYVGGISIINATVTVSVWYLFILSLDRFFDPALNLSSFWSQIQNGLSAAERVFSLIDEKNKVQQMRKEEIQKIEGRIEFRNVFFHYENQRALLEDFNLTILPGQSIAIVGHTGAGKTSIARLLMRFYEFQDGEIFIDDKNIRDLDISLFRKKIGFVPQVPFLFSGSVLENICFAKSEVTENEVIKLAYEIGQGYWLDSLQDGLHTQVGERGDNLSMGQKQLIALMRVLIKKPTIFLFDEATANIDPFIELEIQQIIEKIFKLSTSIIIAHRLSTIKKCERIIVLKDGRIVEDGSHHYLIAQNGEYSQLYETYYRHQSLDYINEAKKTFSI